MTIQTFTFSPFMTNCYVYHDAEEAVIVDASNAAAEEHDRLTQYIDDHGLAVRHLLLTHAHIDHIFGCTRLAEQYGLTWGVHAEDEPLLARAAEQATAFGVDLKEVPTPGRYLEEGEVIAFADAELEVLHTPGHSPGSVSFYDAEHQIVFSGDVLFQGSIGRTDLPGGSQEVLMKSIKEKLLPLGADTRVYPGHGPSTTMAEEERSNPFLTPAART